MNTTFLFGRFYSTKRARTSSRLTCAATAGTPGFSRSCYAGSAHATRFHLATRGTRFGAGCRHNNSDLVAAIILEAA